MSTQTKRPEGSPNNADLLTVEHLRAAAELAGVTVVKQDNRHFNSDITAWLALAIALRTVAR